ncbi:5'/3'-nucleotidase sure family protein [Myriangium duriaei CBS 260.36]|uniref:5'/3'-nucleotidase sure family protein n=1 Tax=Myriangium duriaei CBS 260.36 TaxID=1168546 RepID=A0A9P4JDN8_9PEZI|nr:5'/3'-nucleotidase sure family protein [Myriangium duriaei CBS 260.36]
MALSHLVRAANIVIANDDGWAEMNIRTLQSTLTKAGEHVVISAPATDQSGAGSSEGIPKILKSPCEYNSCPTGSPPTGHNTTDYKLNYINSFPATSMHYGIQSLGPKHFNGSLPDIALSGFNVGENTGMKNYFSGTIAAACKAAKLGIPAIAFHGSTGSRTAWNNPVPPYASIYADLATNLTQVVLKSGSPLLPRGVYLNVNMPKISESCSKTSDFKFVLTRLHNAFMSPDDVETCGKKRLPTERRVSGGKGCHISVSVGDGSTKGDSYAGQAPVLAKLKGLLSCLPKKS